MFVKEIIDILEIECRILWFLEGFIVFFMVFNIYFFYVGYYKIYMFLMVKLEFIFYDGKIIN